MICEAERAYAYCKDLFLSRFETTRWSLILAAGGDADEGRRSLQALCCAYRTPVLAYLRQMVNRDEDAEELTQAFFTYFLEQRVHDTADPARGRFRHYLRGAVRHFVSTQRRDARALKRGGNSQRLDDSVLDQLPSDAPDSDPESEFDRQWALTLIARALTRLESEADAAGKAEWFVALRDFIVEQPDEADYQRMAEKLGMRRNTLAVAVHRLRQRLSELVDEEMNDTVASEDDIAVEQDTLASALRR